MHAPILRGGTARGSLALGAALALTLAACGNDPPSSGTSTQTPTAPAVAEPGATPTVTAPVPVPGATETVTAPAETSGTPEPTADPEEPEAAPCLEEDILEALRDGLVEHNPQLATAIDHASFEEVTCAGQHASVRVERLSDPGYRVILAYETEAWVLLHPLAPDCGHRGGYGIPVQDWAQLMPSVAFGSETGWQDCWHPPTTEGPSDEPLTAAPDGLGLVHFGDRADDALPVLMAITGPLHAREPDRGGVWNDLGGELSPGRSWRWADAVLRRVRR